MKHRVQHSTDSAREGATARRTRTTAALIAVSILAVSSFSVLADTTQEVLGQPGLPMSAIQACASALETSDEEISTAGECAAGSVLAGLLGATLELANQHGRAFFGEQFRIESRMNLAPSGGGFGGDLDAVIPLNSFASMSGGLDSQALFVQNGLTRWTDPHGLERTDVRYGLVHRFAVSGRPDSGVLGTSVFFQENLERGHQRVVTGVDYANRWGTGSLNYFMPTTDWRPGRTGYDERPLEGVELGFQKDATRTIFLDAAAGQWESEDGSGELVTSGRLGVGWKPHPWLGLRGSWEDIGTVDDSVGMKAVVAIPFGGGDQPRPRWQGLGLTAPGFEEEEESEPSVNIWRSVENVGQIRLAEKSDQTNDDANSQDGASAASGSSTVLFDVSGSIGGNQQ
jgi:hypothetical protein